MLQSASHEIKNDFFVFKKKKSRMSKSQRKRNRLALYEKLSPEQKMSNRLEFYQSQSALPKYQRKLERFYDVWDPILNSNLKKTSYYVDCDRKTSEELIGKSSRIVFRPSSIQGYLALSMFYEGKVQHSLMRIDKGKLVTYNLENLRVIPVATYNSYKDLVNRLNDVVLHERFFSGTQ
jgi:hypothetical protein